MATILLVKKFIWLASGQHNDFKVGKLIDYMVYEDDKPMNVLFTSSNDKERVAMLDFEFLAQQLDNLKKSSTRDFQSRKVSALESIPELVASNKAAAVKKAASRLSSTYKTTKETEFETPTVFTKSNLQRLAYILADLSTGSRQIFNYRLTTCGSTQTNLSWCTSLLR